jgi:hypothetical protein
VDNSQTGTDKSVPCPSQPVGACRKDSNERINRINYEISVLQALRERLCCKEIWVLGANRYRNPDEDFTHLFKYSTFSGVSKSGTSWSPCIGCQ